MRRMTLLPASLLALTLASIPALAHAQVQMGDSPHCAQQAISREGPPAPALANLNVRTWQLLSRFLPAPPVTATTTLAAYRHPVLTRVRKAS